MAYTLSLASAPPCGARPLWRTGTSCLPAIAIVGMDVMEAGLDGGWPQLEQRLRAHLGQ